MPEVGPPAIGQWRERIGLTHTIKDGWRVGDATIEFTETASVDRAGRRVRLREMIEDGEVVAAQMNKQNALAKTNIVTASSNQQE